MPRTLILLFHPDMAHSRANAALAEAAARLPGVEVVDLYALYPDGVIDADAEVARLLSADRIVLQFPLQWYSTPPLLKAWQDVVLTRMFYIDYATEGRLLEGKPILLAVTAGNTAGAYAPGGQNLYPLADLLRPLEVTANRCGLPWSEPFIVFEAIKLDASRLEQEGVRYAERLRAWMAPPKPVAPPPAARGPGKRLSVFLPIAALLVPALVAAQWWLARLAPAPGGDWSGTVAGGVLLMAPLVWIFVEAIRVARSGPTTGRLVVA